MSKREVEKLQDTPIFNNDIYLFNGHGEDRVENGEFVKFKLPDNVYYITTTECGKVSQLASVDVLQSYGWRNKAFDTVPKPKTEQYNFNKGELAQIFGVDNPDTIHIHLPGEEITDNYFTPISTIGDPRTNAGYNKTQLDGASGLMKRDDWLALDSDLRKKLTKRTKVEKMQSVQFLGFYEASSFPTKQEVETKLNEVQDPKNKVRDTIRYYFGVKKPVSELINQFKSDNRKTIFFNPLCRVLPPNSGITQEYRGLTAAASNRAEQERKGPSPEGGRRKTRRHKKLKRQTRKRR